ncbi:hypothetical protein ACFCZ1_17340 [Streptomyces sp. NPDC056224]|uniref:hypothetical protein n=1 Tax=Streptomyces sp. NPDC056224 TaxID=3345750 RepID=UPI0035D8A292
MNPSLTDALARRLPEAMRVDPDVGCLAALVSAAPFIPFVLLRDVRRAAVPAGGLALEARLCESHLVESVAADGFVLHGTVRTALRRALREAVVEDGVDLDTAWLRPKMHDGLELLSPLLRIEERVVWTYVTQEDYLDTCDRELASVVRGVAQERRLRMLEWASGAMTRLPEDLLNTPSVWLLAQLCRAQDLPHPQLGWPDGQVDDGLFLDVMHFIPQTVVGLSRDGARLTLGPVSAQRPIGIRVPATQPVSVRVQWAGDPDGQLVSGVDRAVSSVPTGTAAVTIVGLDGRAVQLSAMAPGGPAPEVWDQQRVFDRLEDAHVRRRVMTASPVRLDVGPHGYLVRLREEPAVTAYMPLRAARMPWLEGDPGKRVPEGLQMVRITRVDREKQRVSVSRIRGIVSRGALHPGQLVRATITAKTMEGVLFDLTEAAGLAVPKFERVFGLMRSQHLPASVGWEPRIRSSRSYAMEENAELDVVVTDIQGGGNRSLRILVRPADRSDVPGGRLPEGLAAGDRLWGTVTEKVYHGIRFALDPGPAGDGTAMAAGLHGLVLNTELSWEGRWFYGGGDAREYPLVTGDRCELVVVGVHEVTGEPSLSLKRLVEDPGLVTLRTLRPGSEVDGVVVRRRNNRWRVRLEPWSAIATVAGGSFDGRLRAGARIRMRVRHSDQSTHTLGVELIRVYPDPIAAANPRPAPDPD